MGKLVPKFLKILFCSPSTQVITYLIYQLMTLVIIDQFCILFVVQVKYYSVFIKAA